MNPCRLNLLIRMKSHTGRIGELLVYELFVSLSSDEWGSTVSANLLKWTRLGRETRLVSCACFHKRGQKRVASRRWDSVEMQILIPFFSRAYPPCAKLFSTMRVQKSKETESERGRACSKNKRRAHRAAFYALPWRGRGR